VKKKDKEEFQITYNKYILGYFLTSLIGIIAGLLASVVSSDLYKFLFGKSTIILQKRINN